MVGLVRKNDSFVQLSPNNVSRPKESRISGLVAEAIGKPPLTQIVKHAASAIPGQSFVS
jgi:hypothetical protein